MSGCPAEYRDPLDSLRLKAGIRAPRFALWALDWTVGEFAASLGLFHRMTRVEDGG